MAAKKDDSVEKLRNLIREVIGEESERKERESKDPFERIRGIIREEVANMGKAGAEPKESKEPKAKGLGETFMEVLSGTGD